MSAEAVEPIGGSAREALPNPFLTVRMNWLNLDPSLTAVCAGYEGGQWAGGLSS